MDPMEVATPDEITYHRRGDAECQELPPGHDAVLAKGQFGDSGDQCGGFLRDTG